MDFGRLFSFDGRISRSVFWGLSVAVIVVYVVAALLWQAGTAGVIIGIVLFLVGIAISLATQIKRWHDRDKSGWWIFIALVPLIGGIWALVETGFLAGTPGPNKYGAPQSGSPFDA